MPDWKGSKQVSTNRAPSLNQSKRRPETSVAVLEMHYQGKNNIISPAGATDTWRKAAIVAQQFHRVDIFFKIRAAAKLKNKTPNG